MFEPNQLDYFYSEEETSRHMYRIEDFLHKLYSVLKIAFVGFASVVAYRTLKQQKDMKEYAYQVATKIERTGGQAIINKDKSVSIVMDGKV